MEAFLRGAGVPKCKEVICENIHYWDRRVGGYLAGYLKKYESGNLTLIARKDHKKALIEQGLYVESDALGTLHLQLPVVEDASQLPAQDVIFICVKADQLTEALENIKPIVTRMEPSSFPS